MRQGGLPSRLTVWSDVMFGLLVIGWLLLEHQEWLHGFGLLLSLGSGAQGRREQPGRDSLDTVWSTL